MILVVLRRLVVLAAALAAVATLAPAAFAHANIVYTSPRNGAIVATAPTAVKVVFDSPVTVAAGNAVVDSSRSSVMDGPPHTALSRHQLVLPLKPLTNGDYSARWAIISDDGHFESGVLAFRVGSGGGPPTAVLKAEGNNPSSLDVLARWLFLGGILVAGGSALFVFFITRARAREALLTVAIALALVAAGAFWLLHATNDAATRFGHVTQAAIVVAALAAIAASLAWAVGRFVLPALLPAVALLGAPTLAGHAYAPIDNRWFSVLSDLVHVVAAAFWIGGLVQLAIVLVLGGDPAAPRRFSRIALPVVGLIAISGVARAVVELSSVSQLWSTGYGRAIVVKSVLLIATVLLAYGSRHALAAPARLLRSVSSELAVLAPLVVAVAVLTALRPGRDYVSTLVAPAPTEVGAAPPSPAGAVVFANEAEKLAVALAVRPGSPLHMTATVLGQSGYGVDGLTVRLGAAGKRGARSVAAEACGHGCYTATVPVGGPRSFAVTIRGSGPAKILRFQVPGAWPPPPGTTFLRHATRVFDGLRSVVLHERLSSAPGRTLNTHWQLASPDRLRYDIAGGGSGIVIGTRRWDRNGTTDPWVESPTVVLPQPTAPWGKHFKDAHVLDTTPNRVTATWLDPTVPAWFVGVFDRATSRPLTLKMTAAAHFMFHRYLAYDRPIEIHPPTTKSK
jgi:copper transport protein